MAQLPSLFPTDWHPQKEIFSSLPSAQGISCAELGFIPISGGISCFPHGWPHFEWTKQTQLDICRDQTFPGYFPALSAAPLACSPSQRQTTLPSTQRWQGEASAELPSCLFVELLLKLSKSLAKPLLISSGFSEMLKQNRPGEQRPEHETPLCLGGL